MKTQREIDDACALQRYDQETSDDWWRWTLPHLLMVATLIGTLALIFALG